MKSIKYRKALIFAGVLSLFVIGVSVVDQITNPVKDQEVTQDSVIQTGVNVSDGKINLSEEVFMCPVSDHVSLVRYFYETGGEHNHEALDMFEGIYRPSQGVDYGHEDSFEVMASLSGKVVDVRKDAILGVCVNIECENGITLIYQSLSDVSLKDGDTISQGDLIGNSGHNIYESDLGNHVHLTVEKDGEAINPLDLYNQKVSEIQ